MRRMPELTQFDKREIDDPVFATKRCRRLGPGQRELFQTRAAAAGEDNSEGIAGEAADVSTRFFYAHLEGTRCHGHEVRR